jgi:hypothetical protein
MITTYKTWAIPIMTRRIHNLRIILKSYAGGKEIPKQQRDELTADVQYIVVLGTLVAMGSQFIDKEDDSLIGKTIRKVAREIMTLASAFEPLSWGSPLPDLVFVWEFAKAASQLLRLEKYKDESKGLKGIPAMRRFLTPRMITQFQSVTGAAGGAASGRGVRRAGRYIGNKKSSTKRKF